MYNLRFLLLMSLLLILIGGCRRSVFEYQGRIMGTTYTIKTSAGPDVKESGIENILKRVDNTMSTYRPESLVSQFNRFPESGWFPVSEDVVRVVHCAQRISDRSGGALDITVGPLVDLWGFGPGERALKVVSQDQIQNLLKRTGYQMIAVRLDPPALKKSDPAIRIDLSAVAKGYAVDKVAEYLDSLGTKHYFVEIGGEIRVRGRNPQRKIWKIGISTPDELGGIQKIISLKNAVATSGDYHNYYERDGIRYSHTIDPRTGRPIKHKLASVTVVHDSCMVADGWATALTVLGHEDGYDLALGNGMAVFMIIRDRDGFNEKTTPRFENYLEE